MGLIFPLSLSLSISATPTLTWRSSYDNDRWLLSDQSHWRHSYHSPLDFIPASLLWALPRYINTFLVNVVFMLTNVMCGVEESKGYKLGEWLDRGASWRIKRRTGGWIYGAGSPSINPRWGPLSSLSYIYGADWIGLIGSAIYCTINVKKSFFCSPFWSISMSWCVFVKCDSFP